jgi:MoaD family protein
MMVEVKIPTMLRKHTGGHDSVEASSGAVRDLLDEVGKKHPALAAEMFDDSGELHRFVNIYLNDEDVRYLEGLDTKTTDGDVVSILPAVAGGSPDR